MKLLFDLLPVFVFFTVHHLQGIFVATAAAIAVSMLQVAWHYLRGRRVGLMQWVALGMIIVFGGATLLLRDEAFVKWKPSALYWLLGLALWVSTTLLRRNLLQLLLGPQLKLPPAAWRTMNVTWIGFFGFMGLLNLYVAHAFSTDAWVNFKLFGIIGLTALFVLVQGLYLSRHLPPDGPARAGTRNTQTR